VEQLIRAVVERLARRGMEVTSIPAFIRNVGNTVSAFPSMSLQELNNHLRLLGWDNFELDSYTFYLMLSTFDPDLGAELTRSCDQPLNSNDLSVFADNKEQIAVPQGDKNKPFQE
jgi:hypothetical protein